MTAALLSRVNITFRVILLANSTDSMMLFVMI